MQMEMLEMELIKNLQNTQAMQKQSYVHLEKALMTQTSNKEEIEELFRMTGTSPLKLKKKTKKHTRSTGVMPKETKEKKFAAFCW